MTSPDQPGRGRSAEDRRIRRSWRFFVGSLSVLGLLAIWRAVLEPSRAGWAIVGLIALVGFAAVRHRLAVQALESGRRVEAESFARILQGLSRSISPDHIMDAIVEELGVGTGADHVVVARRRPDARVLEATLVNTRSGGPPSTTLFPITDLEDPPTVDEPARRAPAAVPIEVGPEPAFAGAGGGAAVAAAVASGTTPAVSVWAPSDAGSRGAPARRLEAATRRGRTGLLTRPRSTEVPGPSSREYHVRDWTRRRPTRHALDRT